MEPELEGELFTCGAWETRPAPAGHIRVSEADATIGYTEDEDGWMPAVFDVVAADTDGDGCSELMFSTYPGPDAMWLVPGTVADGVLVDERGVGAVWGGEGHGLMNAAVGDVDGDGAQDDWLLGATSILSPSDGFVGAAYLYPAPILGHYTELDAPAVIWGPADSEGFAHALGCGDLDGGGSDEVVVGWGYGDGTLRGRTLVFGGPLDGSYSEADAVADLEGDNGFGNYLDTGSDLDADGLEDLVISAYSQGAGKVYIFHGPVAGSMRQEDADAVLLGQTGDDNFGHGIAGGGDANLDGYDDLMTSACCGSTQRVYLLLGPIVDGVPLSNAGATFYGSGTFGLESVTLAQDLDSDGYLDPAMGSWRADDLSSEPAGAGYLFYGPVSGGHDAMDADAIFYEDDEDWGYGDLGGFVTGLGDTDGDGYDDLLMGNSGRGPAYIFRGGPR